MIAFPAMLVAPAEKAGIAIPEDIDNYDTNRFPHWHVFCKAQLGTPMPAPTVHWTNAEVVAGIPPDRIMKVTFQDLDNLGFERGFPIP